MQQKPQTTLERSLLLLRLLVSDRLLKWRLTTNQLVWIIRGLIVLGLLLAIGHPYNKGLWDWLELLIVPAVIAVGVLLLDQRQRERDRAAEQEGQRRQKRAMDEQRNRELQVEEQRAQDAALQTYFDQMDEMIDRLRASGMRRDANGMLSFGDSPSPEVIQTLEATLNLMRARTLTLLERLGASRKRAVVRFLLELGFLDETDKVGAPITPLDDANLDCADLSRMNLSNKYLYSARLNSADLSGTNLSGTNLSDADLRSADLSGSQLGTAGRYRVTPSGLFKDMEPLPPNPTNLMGADLRQANLRGAEGWTPEQLKRAKLWRANFEGATMPDGQTLKVKGETRLDKPTFEEWLKSHVRRQDG